MDIGFYGIFSYYVTAMLLWVRSIFHFILLHYFLRFAAPDFVYYLRSLLISEDRAA